MITTSGESDERSTRMPWHTTKTKTGQSQSDLLGGHLHRIEAELVGQLHRSLHGYNDGYVDDCGAVLVEREHLRLGAAEEVDLAPPAANTFEQKPVQAALSQTTPPQHVNIKKRTPALNSS